MLKIWLLSAIHLWHLNPVKADGLRVKDDFAVVNSGSGIPFLVFVGEHIDSLRQLFRDNF